MLRCKQRVRGAGRQTSLTILECVEQLNNGRVMTTAQNVLLHQYLILLFVPVQFHLIYHLDGHSLAGAFAASSVDL